MAAEILLFEDADLSTALTTIELTDVELGIAHHEVFGEAQQFFGKNDGESTIKDFAVRLEGEGSESVRLAVDNGGKHGTWAAPGESIRVGDYLGPGEKFSFWAQALFTSEDRAGQHDFQIVFQGSQVG